MSPIPTALLALLTPAILAAQEFPPENLAASAAFHQASGMLLVVGGRLDSQSSVSMWLWNGKHWRRDTSAGPAPRDEPLLTYDPDRRRVLLFGGERGAERPFTDTWEWTGKAWHRLADAGPPPRLAGQMVYDRERRRVVLFGGAKPGGGEYNDTWEWDGTRWTEVSLDGDPTSPSGRVLFGMAYDPGRRRVVLFGGTRFIDRRPVVGGDTWEWNGSTWQRIDIPGPENRDHLWMVYSPALRAVVLHGGGSPELGLVGDTWKYDGSAWVRLTTEGPVRARHRMAFDEEAGRILLFGGWTPKVGSQAQRRPSDLWVFDGIGWAPVPGSVPRGPSRGRTSHSPSNAGSVSGAVP